MAESTVVGSNICFAHQGISYGTYKPNEPQPHSKRNQQNTPGFPYLNGGATTPPEDATVDIWAFPPGPTSMIGDFMAETWEFCAAWGISRFLEATAAATPPPTRAPAANTAA